MDISGFEQKRGLMKLSDRELIYLGLAQKDLALEVLLTRHTKGLRVVLIGLGVPRPEIDDLCQDTFLRALENLGDYKGTGNFLSWLTTIATRLYWRKLRRDKKLIFTDDPYLMSGSEPVLNITAIEQMDIDNALNKLRPDVRLCLMLFLMHDWTHGQISEHLEIPLGTTKSHILRGLKSLKLGLKSQKSDQFDSYKDIS